MQGFPMIQMNLFLRILLESMVKSLKVMLVPSRVVNNILVLYFLVGGHLFT